MLVLLMAYIFLTTFYGLYFNHQIHITLNNFLKILPILPVPRYLGSKFVTDRQTDRQIDKQTERQNDRPDKTLTQYMGGWVFFYLSIKFATSLLALLAGG